jgi:hypothetical protein
MICFRWSTEMEQERCAILVNGWISCPLTLVEYDAAVATVSSFITPKKTSCNSIRQKAAFDGNASTERGRQLGGLSSALSAMDRITGGPKNKTASRFSQTPRSVAE